MQRIGIRKLKSHNTDNAGQRTSLTENIGAETRYPRYSKGKIIISLI